MIEADVVADLKRSLHDAGNAFDKPNDADWKRLLGVALTAMQAKRPRTLLGTLTITADEVRYALTASDFAQYKTHIWGSRPPLPGSTHSSVSTPESLCAPTPWPGSGSSVPG